jgi:hypothetical protein
MNPLRSKLFWWGIGGLCLSGLSWLPVVIETARANGEKDLGLGFLAAAVFPFVMFFGLAGVTLIAVSLVRSGAILVKRRRSDASGSSGLVP